MYLSLQWTEACCQHLHSGMSSKGIWDPMANSQAVQIWGTKFRPRAQRSGAGEAGVNGKVMGKWTEGCMGWSLNTRYHLQAAWAPWEGCCSGPVLLNLIFLFLFIYLYIYWLCHTSCRILVPRPGIEPAPPAVEAWSLNHWTAREFPKFYTCILLNQRHLLHFLAFVSFNHLETQRMVSEKAKRHMLSSVGVCTFLCLGLFLNSFFQEEEAGKIPVPSCFHFCLDQWGR